MATWIWDDLSGFRSNVTSTLVDLVALSQACSESCSSVSSKESPKCREWADAGECSRNAAFMLKDTLWGMMPCAILEETWNISPPGAGVTRIRESDLKWTDPAAPTCATSSRGGVWQLLSIRKRRDGRVRAVGSRRRMRSEPWVHAEEVCFKLWQLEAGPLEIWESLRHSAECKLSWSFMLRWKLQVPRS